MCTFGIKCSLVSLEGEAELGEIQIYFCILSNLTLYFFLFFLAHRMIHTALFSQYWDSFKVSLCIFLDRLIKCQDAVLYPREM